jgi:hypothetical protein
MNRVYIRNLSRHEFNTDQRKALTDMAMELSDAEVVRLGAPENTFFEDVEHFASEVSGETVSATAPGEIFLELWARTPLGPQGEIDMHLIAPGTRIIKWISDQEARDRRHFAVRGIKVYEWKETAFVANHIGEPDAWGSAILPRVVYEKKIEPTVENDFRTGEEFNYGLF